MTLREIAPWRWGDLRRVDEEDRPMESYFREMARLQRDMERVFDNVFSVGGRHLSGATPWQTSGSASGSYAEIMPHIDETEDEKVFHVQIELPGMDKEDVDVTLSNGYLTIRGEKKREDEERGKDYYRKERSFGVFRRTLPIPAEVNEKGIEARFKKGVLYIDLPKTEEALKKVTHINVKAA
jgi:HSP20 family protein